MSKATVMGYGEVDIDLMDYRNTCDLYEVAIVNPETDEVDGVECYTSYDEWRSAQCDMPGRRVLDMDEERVEDITAYVVGIDEPYEVEAFVHVAYVTDNGEE